MPLRLYVEPMDAVLLDVDAAGRVRFEGEEWSVPSLQERRAILYAAGIARDELTDLMEVLEERPSGPE